VVANRIENLVSRFPAHDNLFCPKNRQVLRGIGLLNSKFFNQLAGLQLATAQQLDDGDPRRMGESLEDLTLELAQ